MVFKRIKHDEGVASASVAENGHVATIVERNLTPASNRQRLSRLKSNAYKMETSTYFLIAFVLFMIARVCLSSLGQRSIEIPVGS